MAELRRRNVENAAADSGDDTAQQDDQQDDQIDQTEKSRPELSTAESSDHVSLLIKYNYWIELVLLPLTNKENTIKSNHLEYCVLHSVSVSRHNRAIEKIWCLNTPNNDHARRAFTADNNNKNA